MQKKQAAVIDIGSSKITAALGERGMNKTFIIKARYTYEYDGFAEGAADLLDCLDQAGIRAIGLCPGDGDAPPGMKAEVKVVYQTVGNLRKCLTGYAQPPAPGSRLQIGDWSFTGEYPTPGGYKVLAKALQNHLEKKNERSY